MPQRYAPEVGQVSVGTMARTAEPETIDFFGAIGLFLSDHRLSSEPAHYAFAYQVLTDPSGPLAHAVSRIIDDGVRLTHRDIIELGGDAAPGRPVTAPIKRVLARSAQITGLIGKDNPASADLGTKDCTSEAARRADMLIAAAELQVSGFSDTVRSIHAETSGFGRDLEASAAAMRSVDAIAGIEEMTRLAELMIERVHSAEYRLVAAEHEADALRKALDEARGCARLDPLTELPNRRAFDEAYAALAPDTRVAIAVCDIDHFKRVNDEFGHAVGDRVLRAIGQTLAAENPGVLVARYGGEEFALLMIDVDLDAAQVAVDRARSAVAARRLRARETDTPIGTVTISAGIAVGTALDVREALYANADAALYRAKAAGRNRVFRAA